MTLQSDDRATGQERVRQAYKQAAFVDPPSASANCEPVPLVRPMPPAEPYPVAGLGPELAAVAEAIQEVVRSPLALCANSVLAVVTLAAQAYVNIALPIGNGAVRPVSGNFLTVGRSGERKSATDEQAMPAVKARETDLRALHKIEHKAWKDIHDAWEAGRRQILAGKGDKVSKRADLQALGDEPEPPLTPILVMEEPTIEGLAKLLMDGQPAVGVFTSEGGQFVGGHAMSDDAKLRSATALSRLWDGEPWKRVRSTDGASTITDRRVSMHLMVQPDVAAQFLNDPVLKDQGLLSRLLVTAPETTMGTRFSREPASAALAILARFTAQMTAAMARPMPLRQGTRNELAPRTLRMSPDARALWIEFSDHVEGLLKPGAALEPISGFAAKMPEHAARLAAVVTWWQDQDAASVDTTTLRGAMELVQYYADEHLRLHQASVVPPDIAAAQLVLDWLQKRWEQPVISVRDICRSGPNSIRVAKRARELVKILEDHHWLSKVPGGAVIGGQRNRDAWSIWGRG
jgi:hypothetical protein